METSDSLDKHLSLFYAELQRLKMILDSISDQKPHFFLIDEMLKGTNALDRQRGSIVLIKQLLRLQSNVIIATHDLELTKLEAESEKIINYHFDGYIEEDKLLFDYKLKRGTCESFNALVLMKKMGIDSQKVDAVFLSHLHGDHTGGLGAFLRQNPQVTVYLPASFPASFQESITALGSECRALDKPLKLFNNVYTSGEMGLWIKEQSLVIDTPKGLVIITGCAHQGIVEIVSQIKNWLQKEVYLVMGGFHLEGQPLGELQLVAEKLKILGVKKVAPSHCTGDAARKLFRELWGQNFLESGVGARIEVLP